MREKFYAMGGSTLLLACSAVVGVMAGVLDAVFGQGILFCTSVREAQPLLMLLLPAGGALICFCYDRFGGDCRRGMGLVFETADARRDHVPFRLIPMAVIATWITHLFGGSVGREGVAVQITASAAGLLMPRLPDARARRHLLMAAVAAGFAGLFRTPVAAIFFAMELFHVGMMEYAALLPTAVAAFVASAVSGALGLAKGGVLLTCAVPELTFPNLGALLVLGIASGLAGRLFVFLLHSLRDRLGKLLPNAYLRIVLVGVFVAVFGLLTAGRYNGLSTGLVNAALAGESLYAWDWFFKLALTALCLAAGYQGGEVAPLFAVGAALGAVLGGFLGLPQPLCAALAYAAVFGAGTNTLVAPVLVGMELFGGQYFGCFFLVSVVAYACNGNHSIYPQRSLPDLWKDGAVCAPEEDKL